MGDDTLTGGAGTDEFVFTPGGTLTITDFSAEDILNLSGFFTDLQELLVDFADDGSINQSTGDFSDNQAMESSILLSGVDETVLTPDSTWLF